MLTPHKVHFLFSYNLFTGHLTPLHPERTKLDRKRNTCTVGSTEYPLAYIAFVYAHGRQPTSPIAFLDGNPLNLSKSNLVTEEFIKRLSVPIPSTRSASGIKGVSQTTTGRWIAKHSPIQSVAPVILGEFDTVEEAVLCYNTHVARVHPNGKRGLK